jgi:hypothetical protein
MMRSVAGFSTLHWSVGADVRGMGVRCRRIDCCMVPPFNYKLNLPIGKHKFIPAKWK